MKSRKSPDGLSASWNGIPVTTQAQVESLKSRREGTGGAATCVMFIYVHIAWTSVSKDRGETFVPASLKRPIHLSLHLSGPLPNRMVPAHTEN